jgi:hypothetical protein
MISYGHCGNNVTGNFLSLFGNLYIGTVCVSCSICTKESSFTGGVVCFPIGTWRKVYFPILQQGENYDSSFIVKCTILNCKQEWRIYFYSMFYTQCSVKYKSICGDASKSLQMNTFNFNNLELFLKQHNMVA